MKSDITVLPLQWSTKKTHHILQTIRNMAALAIDALTAVAIAGTISLLTLPQASVALQNIMWWVSNGLEWVISRI
jgi:hypothetical protein